VQVLRFLDSRCVLLHMATQATPPADAESEGAKARRERGDLERALGEIAGLLDASGAVVNRSKLLRDLINRERKATTAIIPGVAIPHVRTLQVRRFVMGWCRADGEGLPFGAEDGAPTRLFLPLVSPPYDDRTYLLVYRELAQLLADEEVVGQLLAAEAVQEVFNILRRFFA
jgi:mannitol/fructose-specific phosphotransferase system IIA component (Ntr-type)